MGYFTKRYSVFVRRAGELNCIYVTILTLLDTNRVTESCYVIEAGKLKALEELEEY